MPIEKEITLQLKSASEVTNLWGDYGEEYIPHNLSQVLVDSGLPEEEIEDFVCRNGFTDMEEAYNHLLEKFKATNEKLKEKEIKIEAYKDIIKLLY